jgi:hypothetical protein
VGMKGRFLDGVPRSPAGVVWHLQLKIEGG